MKKNKTVPIILSKSDISLTNSVHKRGRNKLVGKYEFAAYLLVGPVYE